MPPSIQIGERGRTLSASLLEMPHSAVSPRMTPGMNIVIPMAGVGSRFKNDGYRHPKPLINIFGRPMIMWLISKLDLTIHDTLWIAHMEYIEHDFHLTGQVKKEFPHLDIRYVPLNFETRGAAETLYIVCQFMNEEEASRPLVSFDCDTLYLGEVMSKLRNVPLGSGAVLCFEDTQPRAVYSYIKHDAAYQVTEIREKVKISNIANSGAYMFADAVLLRTFLNKFLDRTVDSAGEYYTSTIIDLMLASQESFTAIPIAVDDFFCVGTPTQLQAFLRYLMQHPELVEQRRFCFDLDCTLVTLPQEAGDYSTVLPIEHNIKIVQQLKRAGHHIIIHTARRMKTHNGDVQKVIADIGDVTKKTLSDFNIPYDELCFGKPYAHCYVDDLAVHSHLDTQKEIGLLLPEDAVTRQSAARRANSITARSFNDVQIIGRHVIKSSNACTFAGEVYFYEHLPTSLSSHFAALISSETIEPTVSATEATAPTRVITLEKIEGPTFSHLVTSRCLTTARFGRLLDALSVIHAYRAPSSSSEPLVNVYDNYATKLHRRFTESTPIYSAAATEGMEKPTALFQYLQTHLEAYEAEDRALKVDVVHGDPVFSNVLLDKAGDIRLIDMRGKVGETLTLRGDAIYDLAKVYQSICGYDFILVGRQSDSDVDQRILGDIKHCFVRFVQSNYPTIALLDVILVTASLYFSLIPLHDNLEHHKHFYAKACQLAAEHKEQSQRPTWTAT